MCVPDAAGNVFVWAHPGGQLVHFLPALNELVLSLAFTVNTDALVTATWQKASVSCLTKPTVDDVLAMWMGSSYKVPPALKSPGSFCAPTHLSPTMWCAP